MQKRGAKGQLQISFGVIFSIIIIIATVAVAFYVITHFLNLAACTKTGQFYNAIEKDVDNAWKGGVTQETFNGELPSAITQVCFGNLSQSYGREYEEMHQYLKENALENKNVFLYPPGKACDAELASYNLEHATMDRFFCIPVKSGKFSVKLTKGNFDILVKLSKP